MKKQRLTYLAALAAALVLAACAHDDAPATPEAGTATFHIQTRAGQGLARNQHAALYVAERRKESDQTELYCTAPAQNVGGGSYLLENMTAQWYKLAFVCAPTSVYFPTVTEGDAFNSILLDYSPVLLMGTTEKPTDYQTADADLAIYRKVIDRWLLPGEELTEDVTLERITGQLVLDMDVLKEQFAGQVTQIAVTLANVPQKVYLRDNASGEPIYPEDSNAKADCTYTFPISQEQWESTENYTMYFNLLPFELGTGCQIAITRCPDNKTIADTGEESSVTETYPLITATLDEDKGEDTYGTISIRANTRTTVRFNGLDEKEFVVRYYDLGDTGGPGIDAADPDDWNGWN